MQIFFRPIYIYVGVFTGIMVLINISCCNQSNSSLNYFSPFKSYNLIRKNFNPEFVGFGKDVFDNVEKNRPMAYGLIASAETNRFKFTHDSTAIEIVRKAGLWLIANSDLNGNDIMEFGLADSWDAFGDSSINAMHDEYTITTSIAVKGLLDWCMVEGNESFKHEIERTVLKCIEPYLSAEYDSPIGIPAYSLNSNDLKYDVFNPAVYLAGQMQRLSTIFDNDSLNYILQKKKRPYYFNFEG